MTRPVTIFEYQRPENSKFDTPWSKVEVGKGQFHEFGLNYEETNFGVGTFSIAIVEGEHGEVQSFPLDLIRFDDV